MYIIFVFDGIFRPENCSLLLSGRNIPSNTNTIQIHCCCVVSTFRPEYFVKYKYNIHLLVRFHFPTGIFRQIQIQYTLIVVYVLYSLSRRNIPSNTNAICLCCNHFPAWIFRPIQIQYIHIHCCCVCVVSTFRPEYSVKYKYNIHVLFTLTFRPEYSVKCKYNMFVL